MKNERKDKRLTAALIIDTLVGLFLWVTLIVLKATGHSNMHWAVVLSGILWIVWLLMGLTALVPAVLHCVVKLKRWLRRRKRDRRIIRQAKAAGVWDKPRCLGGRALELKAWKLYRIRRRPGESDKELRQRCMTAADNKYADAKRKAKIKDGYTVNITLIDEEASKNEKL